MLRVEKPKELTQFNVVHFAFNFFKHELTCNKFFKNGTEFEIFRLISDTGGNHLLINLSSEADIHTEEYLVGDSFLTILRLPIAYSKKIKKNTNWLSSILLSDLILSELDKLGINRFSLIHFHSWEAGVLLQNHKFNKKYKNNIKYFSPYLTTYRLLDFIKKHGEQEYTLSLELCQKAAKVEKNILNNIDYALFESSIDASFYSGLCLSKKIVKISFIDDVEYFPEVPEGNVLHFVTGGRAVYEKGFINLLKSFEEIIEWGKLFGKQCFLDIFCEDNFGKENHNTYIRKIKHIIKHQNLYNRVEIKNRVPEPELIEIMSKASILIVPSLFDPFCLMPRIAFASKKIVFISLFAGVSENINEDYVYNPLKKSDLLVKLINVLEKSTKLQYKSHFLNYRKVYELFRNF